MRYNGNANCHTCKLGVAALNATLRLVEPSGAIAVPKGTHFSACKDRFGLILLVSAAELLISGICIRNTVRLRTKLLEKQAMVTSSKTHLLPDSKAEASNQTQRESGEDVIHVE